LKFLSDYEGLTLLFGTRWYLSESRVLLEEKYVSIFLCDVLWCFIWFDSTSMRLLM